MSAVEFEWEPSDDKYTWLHENISGGVFFIEKRIGECINTTPDEIETATYIVFKCEEEAMAYKLRWL